MCCLCVVCVLFVCCLCVVCVLFVLCALLCVVCALFVCRLCVLSTTSYPKTPHTHAPLPPPPHTHTHHRGQQDDVFYIYLTVTPIQKKICTVCDKKKSTPRYIFNFLCFSQTRDTSLLAVVWLVYMCDLNEIRNTMSQHKKFSKTKL